MLRTVDGFDGCSLSFVNGFANVSPPGASPDHRVQYISSGVAGTAKAAVPAVISDDGPREDQRHSLR